MSTWCTSASFGTQLKTYSRQSACEIIQHCIIFWNHDIYPLRAEDVISHMGNEGDLILSTPFPGDLVTVHSRDTALQTPSLTEELKCSERQSDLLSQKALLSVSWAFQQPHPDRGRTENKEVEATKHRMRSRERETSCTDATKSLGVAQWTRITCLNFSPVWVSIP